MLLSFPDRAVTMWGAEGLRTDETFAVNVAIMTLLFCAVAWLFVCLGARLGELFATAPPLRAYAIDLAGSLAGVITAVALAALGTTPPWWIFFAAAPVLLWHSRSVMSLIAFAATIVFAALSIDGARFSPYNRIDVKHTPGTREYVLSANRDFHQYILDFVTPKRVRERTLYELPFRLAARHGTAMIVGAGTGNDVAAALNSGFTSIDAVEIDPVIHDVGRLHPRQPYADRRVHSIITDARAFVTATRHSYDVVCYGLLDSHSMFSSMSTLRLDNYVYTTEALKQAWRHVADGGVMSISFMVFQQRFIADRIARNLRLATGETPLVFHQPYDYTYVFVCAKGIPESVIASHLEGFEIVRDLQQDIRPSTDDWPFLYISPGTFPIGYVIILGIVLLIAIVSARAAYGAGFYTRRRFDVPMFFLGAAFLLIEARSVTDLSLLFGSTWIVNAAVFAGVLIVAAIANAMVQWRGDALVGGAIVLLLASVAANYLISNEAISRLPLGVARLVGVTINVLPIGFAGILFSTLLRRSPDAVASLGSNLLGAVAGGIIEYSTMLFGLRAMVLIAGALYVLAIGVAGRRLRAREPGPSPA
jgi:hypothetical protein